MTIFHFDHQMHDAKFHLDVHNESLENTVCVTEFHAF